MPSQAARMSVDQIGEVLLGLSTEEVLELDRRIHEFLETSAVSQAAESAFVEWEDPEEDIYNADV